jgi:hypothetical protein
MGASAPVSLKGLKMLVDVKAFMPLTEIVDMLKAKARVEVEREVIDVKFEFTTDEQGRSAVTGVNFVFGKKIPIHTFR